MTEQLSGDLRELLANPPPDVLEEIERDRAARWSAVPQNTLLWMALAPVWTVALAEDCGLPTASGQDVRSTFELLVEIGLCEYAPDRDGVLGSGPSPGDRFWMTSAARPAVLTGLAPPTKTLSDIGTAVLRAVSAGVPTVLALERWATLAAAGDATAMAALFTETIKQLLVDARSGEALRWVEAARPIAEVVGGEMTAAVARAGGRIEVFHRRQFDLQQLEDFVERTEQTEAFDNLLEGVDGAWALHYFGVGGVGKTTLLRFITAKRLSEDASCARIDFDYLNPDYPGRAPGLLLVHLAEELRLRADTETAARLFSRFDGKVARVHELLGAGPDAVSGLSAIADPEFQSLIESFAEAASRLPQPILIFFDTCEELAKLRPDGRVGPNVEATFSIIDSLRRFLTDMGGDLRVVFSGRRLLASEGANFDGGPPALPVRSYLRLHEIRGFEREVAEAFLEQRGVRAELHAAILQRSLAPTDGDGVRWKREDDQPGRVERHSPFDLALYARWANEDPKLGAADVLAATTDRYIEMRIVRRIHHEGLRALLPTVALLGRLDRDTLRAATDVPSSFATILDELSSQEWIDLKPGGFLEVDRGLAPRLRAYFLADSSRANDSARGRVADHLCQLTLNKELPRIDLSHLEGAFWALAPEPERAGAWWRDVEARFAGEAKWDWALGPLRLLLADEGVAPPRDAPAAGTAPAQRLRPALLATYAAAVLHEAPVERREPLWQEVLARADRHPDPAEAARLRARAWAGSLVDRVDNRERLRRRSIARLWEELTAREAESLDEQIAASYVAGVEAVVEDAERHGKAIDDPQPVLDLADRIREAPLSSFAATLAGRTLALAGRSDEAKTWFEKAVATTSPGTRTLQTWLDWQAPADVGARVRLELLRAGASRARSPQSLLTTVRRQRGTKLGEDASTILGITALDVSQAPLDVERLAAAIVALVTDLRPLRIGEVQDLARIEWPSAAAEPARYRNVFSAFPPFAVQVARALAATGEVGAALDLLTRVRNASESAADALDRVRAAELAEDEIAARMRLTDLLPNLAEPRRVRSDLALTLQGLGVPEPATPVRADPQALHAWWRSRYLLRPELVESALDQLVAARTSVESLSSFTSASLYLDFLEASELAEQLGHAIPFAPVERGRLDVAAWIKEHRDRSDDGFRLVLRRTALDTVHESTVHNDLVARLGARRAARIALEEGELLALRLPERSVTLLDYARQLFSECEDFVGALIAQICSATALARAGRRSQVGPRLRRLTADLALVPGLPSSADLERLADSPSSEALDDLGPREWRPWLVRLLTCLIWDRDGGTPGPRVAALREWLGATYGRSPDGTPLLPAELDGWLERGANEALIDRLAGRMIAARPESLRVMLARARVLAAQGLGIRAFAPLLGIIAAVLLIGGGAFLGIAWLLGPVFGVAAAAVVIAAVLWLAAAERAQLRQVPLQVFLSRRVLSRRRRVPITVSVRSTTQGVAGAIGLPLTIAVELRRPAQPATLATLSVEALRPYGAADPALRALAGSLTDVGELRLEVDIGSSPVAWEGIFALADPKLRRLRARRVVAGSRREARQQATAWTVASIADGLVDRRVAALGLRRSGSRIVPATSLGQLARESEETSALHLIGHCVETASGVRFQLSTVDRHGEIEQSFADGYGELIHTEAIVRGLPGLRLCILQGAPSEARERTSVEREQAAYLRLLGAELFALGVPWVATIPPLPGDLAAPTLAHIARVFRRPVGGRPRPLLESSERARKEISSWPWTDPVARAEAAFDLTVYAADPEGVW